MDGLQLFVPMPSSSSADEPAFDRLSVLPRDILVKILSLLTAKEATATCVLSRSWKYLWVFATSAKMNFDGTHALDRLRYLVKCFGLKDSLVQKTLEEERCKFISRERITIMNQMLGLSSDVEEFRVHFDLTISHSVWIDKWLSYALTRNIKKLELIFVDNLGCKGVGIHAYNFPYKNGKFPPKFMLLKHISFHLVNVSNEDVRFILKSCTLLEHLSLHESSALSSLEIVGTSSSFKSLEVSHCFHVESAVFCDSGIVCLKYDGWRKIPFVFDNVPHLTHLWTYKFPMEDLIDMFSPLIPQLEMFKIYITRELPVACREWVPRVEMPNLKQLVVCFGSNWRDMNSLLPLVHLILKAPCLQRFVVEAFHPAAERPCNESNDSIIVPTGNMEQLKVVEFVGYRGTFRQLELIKHLVDKSVALENLIVDTRSCFVLSYQFLWDRIAVHKSDDEVSIMRYCATKQLGQIPSRINLKIL